MRKVTCIDTVRTLIFILSKEGVLFTEGMTVLKILKVASNILIPGAITAIFVLNIVISVKANDSEMTNWMVCLLIPVSLFLTKELTFLVNRNTFLSILQDLVSLNFNAHNDKLNRHIYLIYRSSTLLFKYFVWSHTVILFIFCALPLVINMKMLIPPPFDVGRFDVLYKLSQLIFCSYVGYNNVVFDVLYMTLMGLGIAQLDILKERLTNVFEDVNELDGVQQGRSLDEVNVTARRILGECIILHTMLIRYIRKLNVLLALPLSVQYLSGCFAICNTILNVTIMGNMNTFAILGMVGYSCAVFAEIALYHWLANEIILKSDEIAESGYVSKWYELDVSYQKSLLLLMKAAQRPLILKPYNLIPISLESMVTIIRWSYSMFALIKASYS